MESETDEIKYIIIMKITLQKCVIDSFFIIIILYSTRQ